MRYSRTPPPLETRGVLGRRAEPAKEKARNPKHIPNLRPEDGRFRTLAVLRASCSAMNSFRPRVRLRFSEVVSEMMFEDASAITVWSAFDFDRQEATVFD